MVDDMSPIDLDGTRQQTTQLSLIQPVRSTESLKPVEDTSNKSERNSLEIFITVISDFLTPAGTTTTDKPKRRLDRPYSENLTTVEALHKIQEQENRVRKRKKPTAAKGANQKKKGSNKTVRSYAKS